MTFAETKVSLYFCAKNVISVNTDYHSCREFPSHHWEESWRRKTCRRCSHLKKMYSIRRDIIIVFSGR